MNLLKPKYLRYVVLGLISALVVTFWPRKEKPQGHPRDYAEIEESGILHAATEYNSISFYVDGDTVSGFHYELIEAFARDKGLQVQVSPVMSFNQRLEGLANGTYDVVAYGIPTTSELKDSLLLTSPIILSKQVLVQRRRKRLACHQKPTRPGRQNTERRKRFSIHSSDTQPQQ